MHDSNHFPDSTSCKFTEKDQICHSLIEAALFQHYSNDYVLSMLSKLKCYANEHGKDIIIDALFMKYLKHNRIKYYKEEINNFNAKLVKKQNISQYAIAYVCFNDPRSKFSFKKQIYEQAYKFLTNEKIIVNGIEISKVICFYLLNNLFNSFTRGSCINANLMDVNNKNDNCIKGKDRAKISNENKNFLKRMKQYSKEIKNLIAFVYFLVVNGVSIANIDQYKKTMSLESFQIMNHVYNNFSNQILDINDLLPSKINTNDENDFMMLLLLHSINKNEYNNYIIKQNNNDLLYIATKEIDITNSPISGGSYSIMKKEICKGNIHNYENNSNFQHFDDDFDRFIQKAIDSFDGITKIDLIKLYINKIKSNERKIELIFELIYMKEYDDSIILLNNIEKTEKIKNILTDELHFQLIKEVLSNVQVEYACEFINKFEIKDMLTQIERINIVFQKFVSKMKLKIDRSNILNASMEKYEKNSLHHRIIRIFYESEEGIDSGGLAKDWFTNVCNEIISTNAFISTPNGKSLTINNQKDNLRIYKFVGQFIASAFINKRIINIKLASFIWKTMINEQIGLEDMKDYDDELYQSLKWISENDPKPLMMTFVDGDDTELCEGGMNIDLTEENKEEFIRLMIEKKLIKQNSEAIEQITSGFREIVDLNLITIFTSEEIKNLVNGIETIDVNDWKKNTKYEIQYKKEYNNFFSIISKWPQEKLSKLLKFATGSSIVPVQGFKYFEYIGGLFELNFLKIDTGNLPEAHTCFNRIDMPCYETVEKFESKLSLAIECDTFTIN